jgi:hypothetical protein
MNLKEPVVHEKHENTRNELQSLRRKLFFFVTSVLFVDKECF